GGCGGWWRARDEPGVVSSECVRPVGGGAARVHGGGADDRAVRAPVRPAAPGVFARVVLVRADGPPPLRRWDAGGRERAGDAVVLVQSWRPTGPVAACVRAARGVDTRLRLGVSRADEP